MNQKLTNINSNKKSLINNTTNSKKKSKHKVNLLTFRQIQFQSFVSISSTVRSGKRWKRFTF